MTRNFLFFLMLLLSLPLVACTSRGGGGGGGSDDDDSAVDDDDATPPPTWECDPLDMDCDDETFGDTNNSDNNNDDWATCVGYGPGYTAGDDIWELQVSDGGMVTANITWSDSAADLDLFVLDDCSPTAGCLAESSSVDPGEEVNFEAEGGQTVYLVVDGWGTAAAYTLWVGCDQPAR